MKSFKFFRGYVDPTGMPLNYDRVGARRLVLAGLKSAEDIPDEYGRVGTRRINATWTREMAEDVSRFHNIDAEAELSALLTETIAQNIDRNILRGFRQIGASIAFSQPFELRRINNEIEVSQAGVRFIRTDNTPIIPGII